jgi:hypothetical protein
MTHETRARADRIRPRDLDAELPAPGAPVGGAR